MLPGLCWGGCVHVVGMCCGVHKPWAGVVWTPSSPQTASTLTSTKHPPARGVPTPQHFTRSPTPKQRTISAQKAPPTSALSTLTTSPPRHTPFPNTPAQGVTASSRHHPPTPTPHPTSAPKVRPMPAQGNALGFTPIPHQAPKGRHIPPPHTISHPPRLGVPYLITTSQTD